MCFRLPQHCGLRQPENEQSAFQAALNGTSAARRQLVKQSNPIEYTLRRQAIAVPF
ncbi:hypothetical protein GCWU000324_00496 [Kingella oralis ATCC 51147]|uniref:Uncharacterized protein n=1 Tax=Kingella oralis ATCC 51147 TaxID=629741 RepID=C4GI05_9NEIS|nr:hypothetical protein GCWU000324_00496 [Kingella oralis ATCC 51147]